MNITKLLSTLGLATLISTSQVLALSSDRDQPAEIEADEIEFDFKKGIRTYLNNVLIVQGTLRLKADKLVAVYKSDELEHATAWGTLARFKQRPDGKEDDVEGWARKIIVNQKQNTLTLIGKAALRQGADTARADTIIYNMATDTLSLKGGAELGGSGKNGQAKPKPAIKDPFQDSHAEPVADKDGEKTSVNTVADAAGSNGRSAEIAAENTETAEEEIKQEQTSEVEPVRAGRSRLIIQPK